MTIISKPRLSSRKISSVPGFSLLEILVGMSLFVVVVVLVGSVFVMAQRTYMTATTKNELSQNLRVYFDRLSREIRQANDIVTDVSATTTEILFEDGHETSYTSYIRYYQLDSNVYRQHIAYACTWPTTEDQYVRYNVDCSGPGDPPDQYILDSDPNGQIIGEYFNELGFRGENGLLTLNAELQKRNIIVNFDTKAYVRNGD